MTLSTLVPVTPSVGGGTGTGPPGPPGPPGGSTTLWKYNYSTVHSAPPNAGQVRTNGATAAATTTIWVHRVNADNIDVRLALLLAVDGDKVLVQDAQDSTSWATYTVVGAPVDAGNYVTFTVTNIAVGATALAGTGIMFGIVRKGTPGPAGPGVPTGGTTGQLLAKTSATDYATGWIPPPSGGGGGLDPALYDANTILKADTDNTPVALPVGPSTLVGRAASGAIAALNASAVSTLLGLGSLATKSAIADGDVAVGANIALTKLAVDPRARSNHTGTQLTSTLSDLSAALVPFTPTGSIAATNVQAAIAEVAAEAGGGGGPPTTLGTVTAGEWAVVYPTESTRLGFEAGTAFISPTRDTVVGYQAGKKITTGSNNTALGHTALQNITTGNNNTAVGYQAGSAAQTNNADNTYVGYQAASAVIGSQNTIVGSGAGVGTAAQTSVALGYQVALGAGPSYAIGIGPQATVGNGAVAATAIGYLSSATADFAIAIGCLANASASGAVAIGRDSAGNACTTSVIDEIKLGTALHKVNIPGTLTVGGVAVPSAGGGLGLIGSTEVLTSQNGAATFTDSMSLTVSLVSGSKYRIHVLSPWSLSASTDKWILRLLLNGADLCLIGIEGYGTTEGVVSASRLYVAGSSGSVTFGLKHVFSSGGTLFINSGSGGSSCPRQLWVEKVG